MKASLLYPSQCFLGEGPTWHVERNSCFWVDIENGVLYEFDWMNHSVRSWEFEYKVSVVIQCKKNKLVLGLNGGIASFDLESEKLVWLADIEKELTRHRCNDGACDSHGRIWIGTMDMQTREGAGSLYCIDKDLSIRKKLGNVTISNGLAWSLDNKRLYFIDSPTQKIQSFIFNEATGEIKFENDVIHIPPEMGTPDGMTIDEEGMLWVAHWGGFGIYRWNPANGEFIEKVEVPAPNVTSCTFAGDNLDHLVITTARQDLNEEQLKQYPLSGDVFFIKTAVKGVRENKCML
jgi:sugar lactone lactonase YvrE